MSEDIVPASAKPTGSGLTSSDDIDTRMKYKESQKGPSSGKSKVKVTRYQNKQREVKL